MSNLSMMPISELKQIFGLKAMVETGTEAGYGVKTGLKAGFKKICSCEILKIRYEEAVKRFQNDDRVYLFQGSSKEKMLDMLVFIKDAPALFWLDAHLPNCHDTITNYSIQDILPAGAELWAIYNQLRDCSKDVILIDDLCLINKKYRDEKFDLQHWTSGKGSNDIKMNWFHDVFNKHHWYQDKRAEGVLVGLPKLAFSEKNKAKNLVSLLLIDKYNWEMI